MRYPSEPIYDGVAASHRTSNVGVVSMAFNNVRYSVVASITCPVGLHCNWNLRPIIAVLMVFNSTLLGSGLTLDVQ